MIDALPVSVVIVSRERPDALARCLRGIAQLRYPTFEVVVVADKAGAARLWSMPEAAHVKLIRFDEPNISVARNLGICEAAGDVVAFIDDDAVPEPSWLTHLAAPFSAENVSAAGGFVRGRNGISWQWRAQSVDLTGYTVDLFLDPNKVTLLSPTPEKAIKTEGTNMAVRRDWLADQGGFDPRFHYFLDETDVNLRLAEMGCITAIAPQAQVHHGFAANDSRTRDRVPRDLTQIAASWSVFLDKYCPRPQTKRALARARHAERVRALRHMVAGRLEPRDVGRLMASFDAGLEIGHARGFRPMPPLPEPSEPFRRFPTPHHAQSVVVAGRVWRQKALLRKARLEREAGRIVTLISLSPTIFRHRVAFSDQGIWIQRGGIFGKSDRRDPTVRFWPFNRRVNREVERIRTVRLID
ncbi:MAG: glycosyltransferase family 2 protein [Marinibacterium sp.]